MRKVTWIPVVMIGLALCSCTTQDPDADPSATPSSTPSATPTATPTPVASDLVITGSITPFQHTCGSSPCPQDFGTVTIVNNSVAAANVTTAFSGTGNLPFQMDVSTTTVPASGSTTLTTQFNCSAWDGTSTSVNGTLSVAADNGTETNQRNFAVGGTIVPCP